MQFKSLFEPLRATKLVSQFTLSFLLFFAYNSTFSLWVCQIKLETDFQIVVRLLFGKRTTLTVSYTPEVWRATRSVPYDLSSSYHVLTSFAGAYTFTPSKQNKTKQRRKARGRKVNKKEMRKIPIYLIYNSPLTSLR